MTTILPATTKEQIVEYLHECDNADTFILCLFHAQELSLNPPLSAIKLPTAKDLQNIWFNRPKSEMQKPPTRLALLLCLVW